MTVMQMVDTYKISLHGTDNMQIANGQKAIKDGMVDALKAAKPDIMAYLQQQKADSEARKAKIEAIEGLAELRDAIYAMAQYKEKMNKMFDSESGVLAIAKPTPTPAEVSAKYPRAAAYIKAENWTYSENYKKSAIGKNALEAIINGGDHEEAIKAMEDTFDAACDMWN